MKRMRYWFASKKLLMAQLHDLQRQLQEAWTECDTLGDHLVDSRDREECLRDQLHRVARERDNERKLRLEAEDRLLDYHLDGREKNEIDRKTDGLCEEAQNWKDAYLQLNQQYVEDLETMSNEEE